MKKKVNIYPRKPITATNPPIRGAVQNVTKDTSDIRKCIIAGAKVEEIGPGNQIALLNLRNYDLDNFSTEAAEVENNQAPIFVQEQPTEAIEDKQEEQSAESEVDSVAEPEQKLTKKQRKAIRRAIEVTPPKQEELNEVVETKDAENM